MFVFNDALVERIAKETGLTEWQIRHAAKKLIAAGLVQDLGANLFDMPKLEPEKIAEKMKTLSVTLGLYPVGKCGADFGAFIHTQYDEYTRIVREADIKVE